MMIQDIFHCYLKLALPPTQCQCQYVGLGLFVVEVSRTGRKEMHIRPPCSPSCALVAVLLGQNAEKLRVKELVLWSTYIHIHTQTYVCI